MTTRRLEFASTAAVRSARQRAQYIPCPACGSRAQRYLFHRTGVRFVQCRACDLVYADPVDPENRAYFDMRALSQHEEPIDRQHAAADFGEVVGKVSTFYEEHRGRAPKRVLALGRWHPDFANEAPPGVEVEVCTPGAAEETQFVTTRLTESFGDRLGEFDVILLHEFLEAVHDPMLVLDGLAPRLAPDAIVAVVFANMQSIPSRFLRRRWKSFFDRKIAFFDARNLESLMWRAGFRRLGNQRLHTSYSLGYLAARLDLASSTQRVLDKSGFANMSARAAAGREVIFFAATAPETVERLSVIVPVYNEERYVGEVLDALLAKELPLEREIIVVESNSTDGSREIVRSFDDQPDVTVIYQDEARGKGHAVREGLAVATGTIVLIQDADFEYDLDDYDALLEPIVQRRSSFVLGSRSLGLDDWKVRRYASSRVKGFLMNFAQVVFARTFNVIYQQHVTDINTMLKVFRRECIDNCHLTGDGFNFDIELVCKIVRNGFEPLEVPVNYVARGFDEGKKINFLLDAWPSYWQLFRCRLGPF